ncbi:unnamed protein product [Acanthoscelides obtectus]|uniref:Uncharacterized protein n=1 Tax=Acanthoscelides obtectus TaxID=200917 RepID=A0A9P0PQU4_ACAOB|nr:unnamed protein product [Acanthoscelides obtectus]CAK1682261.1 hypothetical protein AOBTE_LOCUS33516 [Acanthoscelides obtectus]
MMCKRCKHVFCWTTSFCGIARKWSASSPASATCFWPLRRSCC